MKRSQKTGKLLNWLALGSSVLLLSTCSFPLTVFSEQVLAQEAVQQLSETQLEQLARSITVKIVAGNNGGSGVIIKKEGTTYTVLTNEHVLTKDAKPTIETADGKIHQARLVPLYFQGKDLALLQFNSNVNYSVATLGSLASVQKGDKVFVAGFPFQNDIASSGKFAFVGGEQGRVSFKLTKPLQGGYLLGYTNEVEKGMSGGPILNAQGELIGINGLHAQPLWGDPYVYEDGKKPNEELVNDMRRSSWGVPIEVLAQLAPNYAPTIAQSPPATGSTQPASMPSLAREVDQKAKEISVLITWSNDDGTSKNGTGVIIAQEGKTYYVLTAKHVASQNEHPKIITHDGQVYQSQRIAQPIELFKGKDLALLQFTSEKSYQIATIGDYPRSEEAQLVFVSGWPTTEKADAQTLETKRKLSAGYLLGEYAGNNLATDFNTFQTGYSLLYTNITENGMSGGPVLDQDGHLIGIHTAAEGSKDGESPIPEKTKGNQRLDYGYSIGIPIQTFLSELKQKNVPLKVTTTSTVPRQLGQDQADQITTSLINLQVPDSQADEIAWLNYGNKLWRLRRYGEAQQAFKKSIKIKPTFEAWYGHGLALVGDKKSVSNEDWKQSLVSFKEAQKLRPDSDLAWRQIGDSYWYLQEYEQSLQAFQKAIELRPNDFILYNWVANAYQDLGRYTEALKAGNKSIQLNPNFAESYFRRGYTYTYLNDYTAAIADIDQAIALNPNQGLLYRLRAIWHIQLAEQQASEKANSGSQKSQADHEQILADFDQAIKLSPHDPFNYTARGNFYAQIGNREQFEKDLDQAFRLDPDNAEVYQVRAYSYIVLKEPEKALSDFTKAIDLAPESAHLFYTERGDVRRQQGDIEGAIKDYTSALGFRSNHIAAYQRRGIAYAQLKDKAKAFQDLDKALSLAPDNVWTYTWRGDAYFYLGEQQPGYQEYQKGINANKELAYIFYLRRANTFADLGDYDVAIKDYTEIIRLKPNNSFYYNKRGNTYLNWKKYDEAIVDYTMAIQLEPNNGLYYSNRGYGYYLAGKYPETIADLDKAIALNPEDSGAYNVRGIIYEVQGKYPEAIAEYTKAIKIEPKNAVYNSNRGYVYYLLEMYPEAFDDLKQAITLNPKLVRAYNNRGHVYIAQQEYAKAIADYTVAIQLQPDNAVYHSNRGNTYRFLQEYEKALADLNQALTLDPQYSIAYNYRGIVYYKQKKYPEAIVDYSKAIELEPKNALYYANRAYSYADSAKYLEAIDDFTQAISLNRMNASYYVERAYLLNLTNDQSGAIRDLNIASDLYLEQKNEQGYQQVQQTLNNLEGNTTNNTRTTNTRTTNTRTTPPTANDAESYFKRGNEYFDQKNYTEAINAYTEVILLEPDAAVAYFKRAWAWLEQGNNEEAINDLDAAIKIDPNYRIALVFRGSVREQIKDYQGALEDYNRALSQSIYAGIGTRIEREEKDSALVVREVFKGTPAEKGGLKANDRIIAIDEVSTLKVTQEQYQDLINNRIRGQAGTKISLTIERAGRKMKLTLTREAIIDPEFAIAYYNRGLLKAQLGDSQGAKKDLQTAADLYQRVNNTQMYQTAVEKLRAVE